MSVSILLVMASAAQIAVWSFQLVLPHQTHSISTAYMHGWLFERLALLVESFLSQEQQVHACLFVLGVLAGMLAGTAWFFAARAVRRPIAAWVVGLLWFAHPGAALTMQRQTSLMVFVALAALLWWCLLSWSRSRRFVKAAGVGAVCAAVTLMSLTGVGLTALIAIAMLLRSGRLRTRLLSPLLMLVAFAAVTIPVFVFAIGAQDREERFKSIRSELWVEMESGDGSELATHARRWESEQPPETPPAPLRFLVHEFRHHPLVPIRWMEGRLLRTLNQTADGTFGRPLLAFHLVVLIPVAWAILTSWRDPDRRWYVYTGASLGLWIWFSAAATEPLARNLLPAAGSMMLIACVGIADARGRIFARWGRDNQS